MFFLLLLDIWDYFNLDNSSPSVAIRDKLVVDPDRPPHVHSIRQPTLEEELCGIMSEDDVPRADDTAVASDNPLSI